PNFQVNFITCQVVALCFSLSMKRWIKDPHTKLIYTLICGLGICLFCFGNQIFHIIASAGLGYILIKANKSSNMPWIVLGANMFYLSSLHLQRQFFDELGSYSLDITGPLMVLTQKVTSLAFSLQDAIDQKKSDDYKGTEMQKKYAVLEAPSFLEYWSFVFQFQSMLAGPLVLFKDFREFIHTDEFPSPLHAVVKKMGVSVFFAVVFIKVTPVYSIERLKETEFLWDTTFLYRMFYVTIATMMERAKYYHAWILADAVCNASGLGYDKQSQTWDLVTNVDALGFELGLNLKESLDSWNRGTMKWLRHVVYERVNPSIRTVATYAMSAIWHGYYPGYYITFLSGSVFTSVARQVRKIVRPLFVNDRSLKLVYDFFTWLTTRFVIAYVTFSFIILDFTPSILLYLRLYCCFHFAAFGAMFALPKLSKHLKNRGTRTQPQPATRVVTDAQPQKDKTEPKKDTAQTPATEVTKPIKKESETTTPKRGDDESYYGPKTATKELISHEYPEIKSYLRNSKPTNDVWTTWTMNSAAMNGNAVQLKTG
ncbi:Membrane-bound O-acyltransferase domain-containing protein 2, partial [Orchesella cincta]